MFPNGSRLSSSSNWGQGQTVYMTQPTVTYTVPRNWGSPISVPCRECNAPSSVPCLTPDRTRNVPWFHQSRVYTHETGL